MGLLGPNGAGKTTTFYMIVGLIPPQQGRILFDGEDITEMPTMYRRARRDDIGVPLAGAIRYSARSCPSRTTSCSDPRDADCRSPRSSGTSALEHLLDELGIKHLRTNKAYALSGGERRRLEITRALVTQPKFMMLDEPFAGVDPIAVHDIQTIVAGLRHRGIRGVLIQRPQRRADARHRGIARTSCSNGLVKVSGTVQQLVFDETVAEIYLGPTLTARLRARFSAA